MPTTRERVEKFNRNIEKDRAEGRDKAPLCGYCGKVSTPAFGREVYPKRRDLFGKKFFVCWPCDARVGCHRNTWNALGTPARAPLRGLRSEVHRIFDKLWRNGPMSRGDAYRWLAKAMDVPKVHIGEFTEDQCRAVLAMESTIEEMMGQK